ncbi:hypothetical protein [Flavobacterium gelatinilyticum]|uniref:hypothetical protein n=1 Tax=Flavobacterium gelatinilyticum TaxID=3003260 RepID=UPI00248092D8|nr:hypothetical protein [Flavobacterium gelatinilyticum]
MKKDLKNVKLILLGLITTVIPILFIFQAENIDTKNSKLVNLKITNDSLVLSNKYKDSLISFLKRDGNEQPKDTIRINFNPAINIPKSVDYSKSLDAINQSLKNIINDEIKKSSSRESNLIYIKRIDSLRKIITERNRITQESLKKSKIIENRILQLCQDPKTTRKEITRLLSQFEILCYDIDTINSNTKWKNILD